MAAYTSNYGWTKPSGSDNVDISVLNDNLDNQDRVIHDAFLNMAVPFSELSTYAVDDVVLYGTTTYKCHTAVVTPGSWTGSTNWQVYKLSEGGSGGGGSSLTAGDYIEIDENDKINVKLQKGDYEEYEYRLLTDAVNVRLTIEKYVDGTLVDTESYLGPESYTPISIDGFFEIWYGQGGYIWRYKLLKDSQSHSAGYETSWYYTVTDEHDETFEVADSSSDIVVKRNLKNVATSGSYTDLSNKPQINSVELSGNKTASDLGLQDKTQYSTMPTASADNEGKIYQYVGTTDANYTNGYYYKCVENSGIYSWQLVENIKEQTPTFSQASTRNNIASGEKLSVILGKVQKFFNDLKTVAFSGSYTDLSNKPENANTFQGTIAEWNQLSTAEKKAYDHASIPDSIDGGVTFPADKVIMTGGGNVEDAIGELNNLPANYSARTDVYGYNTPQNCYVCPSDGYIEFKGDASTVATLYSYHGNDDGYGLLQTRELRVGIFVRKGLKFWMENATQGVFISLV